jgi:cardiolipin synthase
MSLLRQNRWQSIESLELLEGGKDYFPAIEAALMRAQKSIYLEVYIFSADDQAQKIAKLLADAALKGLDVKVIVDWFGSSPFQFEAELRQSGVQLQYYNPGWFGPFGFSRTHRKILVIDELEAYLGGVNICDDAKDSSGNPLNGLRWDLALRATGGIVEKVHATFLRQWQRLQPDSMHPKNILRRILEQELPWGNNHFLGLRHGTKSGLALVARDNLHHRRDIERASLKAIGQSKEEIWLVTPYFLPGRRLRKALIHAAQRGVAVNLLLGRDEFRMLNWSVPSLYDQLLKANITLYEYPNGLLHAKAMVVDRRWATLGSSNYDHFSFLLNHEANLIVRNHEVIKEIRCKIADQAVALANQVDPAIYDQRPIYQKLANWISYGFVRFALSIITAGTKDKALPSIRD